ncbi:MAG: hypothetical protein K2Z80_07550 [Xanthobacteraceae bacterium]|nr:hypothetical protein [Xanthobacteraceae bacterium]
MLKQQKTKHELEVLIRDKAQKTMELDEVSVFGVGSQWRATFTAKPHLMMPYGALFRTIVMEMRGLYELNRVA